MNIYSFILDHNLFYINVKLFIRHNIFINGYDIQHFVFITELGNSEKLSQWEIDKYIIVIILFFLSKIYRISASSVKSRLVRQSQNIQLS